MKKKKLLILLLILIVLAFIGYKYVYQSHRDISSEDASFAINVETLATDFKNDEAASNAKYLDQTISVSGTITEIDTTSNALVIDNVLFTTFNEKIENGLQKGSKTTIKGRFIGFDELLEEFKMDQCSIVK